MKLYNSVPAKGLLQNLVVPLQDYFPYLGVGDESLTRRCLQLPGVHWMPYSPCSKQLRIGLLVTSNIRKLQPFEIAL